MKNKTFAQIVGTKIYTVTIGGNSKTISNTNELLGNINGVYGIKTGFTNGANRCLVSCCKRNNMDIICVVLGADTKNFRTKDSIKLIEYTFKNFVQINIKDIVDNEFDKWKKENLEKFNINKGVTNLIDIKTNNLNNNVISISKDNIDKINAQIQCETNLSAPILINQKIGTIKLFLDDEVIDECDICVLNDISKKNIGNYLIYFFKEYKTII